MWKIFLALVLSLFPACHNGDSTDMGPRDMAVLPPDMTMILSQCGHPGDKGNSLGVGKFCTAISDCQGPGLMTNICSALGNGRNPSPDDTYFCTIYPCKQDAGAAGCGENATCVCGSSGGGSGCACTPNACIGPDNPDLGSAKPDLRK